VHTTLTKLTRYLTGTMIGMAILMGAVWSFQSPVLGGAILGASITPDELTPLSSVQALSTLAPELNPFAEAREAGPVRVEIPAYSTTSSNRLDLQLTYLTERVSHIGYTLLPTPAVRISLTESDLYAGLTVTYKINPEWSSPASLLLCRANECTPLSTELGENQLRSTVRLPGVIVAAVASQ